MKSCNHIQRLIDEAEQISSLSFEASNHLDSCEACRTFANERMRLRALLGNLPSITVPANFNGQLKARLEEAKAKPSFAWLRPAIYLRYGTATAVLLVAAFAVQYSGIFNSAQSVPNTNIAANTGGNSNQPLAQVTPVPVPRSTPSQPSSEVTTGTPRPSYAVATPVSTTRRIRSTPRRSDNVVADEFDMPDSSVRPFSVGAQDRIYMRADSATPVRTVSF
jgi:hypothetical protein